MFRRRIIQVFISTIFSSTLFANGPQGNFVDFDVPGAKYTGALCISENGIVAGDYALPGGIPDYKGFIRMPNGEITTFEIAGVKGGIMPVGINNAGTMTGTVRADPLCGQWCGYEGFVRTLDGKITRFQVPGTKGGTYPTGINEYGVITGYAQKEEEPYDTLGFVRQADGTFTTFDAPGAKYTKPLAINNAGLITGCYHNAADHSSTGCDDSGSYATNGRGFLRKIDGTFTTFDVSGAALTYPKGINDQGVITGFYNDSWPKAFVRNTDGVISIFDIPGAKITQASKINNEGVILGMFFRPFNKHEDVGFTRDSTGAIREWSHPLEGENATNLKDINGAGVAVGSYSEYLYRRSHAFILNTQAP